MIVPNDPWTARLLMKPKARKHDYRPFDEKDRSRIIHCASFRRLQGKTQVLGITESDFHRTRLTHTMEVAQIGRAIVLQLRNDRRRSTISKEAKQWLPSPEQI